MNKKIEDKKELVYYVLILIVIVIIVIFNNTFWEFGKSEVENNNIEFLKSGNIIYNVPFEEQWFD